MKAKFETLDKKITIPVHYNPSAYTITANTKSGESDREYLLTDKNEQLSMDLYFDTFMTDKDDVRNYTEPIFSLTYATDNKRPIVKFIWGSLEFTGIVSSVTQKFTMFMSNGKPVRAELDVTMKGANVKKEMPKDNASIDWYNNDWKKSMGIIKPRDLL
jgi:hypothetical protein